MESGRQGGRARERREGWTGSGTVGRDGGIWLYVTPEVDASQVLKSDPTQPQDDEVLDVNDWFDGSKSTFGHFELRGNLCRNVEVGEGFWDCFLYG